MSSGHNIDLPVQVFTNQVMPLAADALIYGVNALNICYDFCSNYQKATLPDLYTSREVTKGPLTDRAMSHIHGDNYIQNTELEGWFPSAAKNTLEDLVQDFPDEIKQKILDLTSKLQFLPSGPMNENEILSKADQIAKEVRDLKIGEDFWLEGGGNDHAMFYQFIKKSDRTYDIYIHNTGAGLEYHYQEAKKADIPDSLNIDSELLAETSFQK